ncbi:MAG TPA: PrsW family glutamic-type intramembrane protease [Candidatus Paceibacterota bacterium]|nr:PrsW family glutamic-type intramembrane protease [Candidatus Paceibacterota bacterium]
MPSLETIGYALVGGLLPALAWLYFLLKEEDRCPQPRWAVVLAFVCGMIAVPIVMPLQALACREWAISVVLACSGGETTLLGTKVLIAWSALEETAKYAVAAAFVLWRRHAVRNSLDIVATMLTVALGFAALENALFLLAPFSQGYLLEAIGLGNLRFIGSTLLHVVASSIIGFALAFSYKSSRPVRAIAASIGLILAIALHAVFNFFIIQGDGSYVILALFTVWTGAVAIFAAFEILKYFLYRNLPKNTC